MSVLGNVTTSANRFVAGSICVFTTKASTREITHSGNDGIRVGRRGSGSARWTRTRAFAIGISFSCDHVAHAIAEGRRPIELEAALTWHADPIIDEFLRDAVDLAICEVVLASCPGTDVVRRLPIM